MVRTARVRKGVGATVRARLSVVRIRSTGHVRLYLSEHKGDAGPDTLIPLYVKNIDAVSTEFGIPIDKAGLAGRECDLVDPHGNRLRVATRRQTTSSENVGT